MFQRLDELQTGSMYILTGQAGAGKSHLAASERSSGAVWVLDTEGASQNLINKPGIHKNIQAVQTLSLRQLLDAMREVKRIGHAGDTVILDSISKVLQAMRSYAQQRAGAETNRKASLSYDEHASVNRNLQAIYTGLTELKHAGFNVLVIGHLAKKYQTNGSSLADAGLRVLADENITYEADAILLVECTDGERSITPIIKPPRPQHLQLGQSYEATIATLYPESQPADEDQAVDEELPANISQFPRSVREAELRFYGRYRPLIGVARWQHVVEFFGQPKTKPKTIQGWIDLANDVRTKIAEQQLDGPAERTG